MPICRSESVAYGHGRSKGEIMEYLTTYGVLVHSITTWAHPNNTFAVVDEHRVTDGVTIWYLSEGERAECLNPTAMEFFEYEYTGL